MRIAFGADDQNATTAAVLDYLRSAGHTVAVLDDSDKWPEIGSTVGRAVVAGEADYGVVMCWTGTGTAIAANKVPGVRAALAWDPWIARGARLWNDANVLALSLKRLARTSPSRSCRHSWRRPSPTRQRLRTLLSCGDSSRGGFLARRSTSTIPLRIRPGIMAQHAYAQCVRKHTGIEIAKASVIDVTRT